MRPNIRGASSIRLSCVYDVLVVVVVRYKTIPAARRALLFIVRAFFNDTITVAVWTGFHVRLIAMLPHSRDYIPQCFAGPAVVAARVSSAAIAGN
jgi:hypothetical protein